MNWLTKLWSKRSHFDQIFLAREFSELAGGKRWLTVWQLALIIFITLSALAFGIGSLDRLEKKMQSPFSNIFDMGVFYQDYAKINSLKDTLTLTSRGVEMGLDTMSTWYKFKLPFQNKRRTVFGNEEVTTLGTGRTMDLNSSLFQNIFLPDNIVANYEIEEDNRSEISIRPQAGLVVTEDFLKGLGYSNGDVQQLAVYDLSVERTYFLPIMAVVRQLPSKCDFLTSLTFYENLFLGECSRMNNPFIVNRDADNNIYLIVEQDGAEAVRTDLMGEYGEENLRSVEIDAFFFSKTQPLSQLRLIFEHSYVRANAGYLEQLRAHLNDLGQPWMEYTRLSVKKQACGDETPQRVSFLFQDLSKISEFSDYLWSDWEIQLPLEEVKNRENFALVSALGYFIGIMLLLFAILSTCLFMRSLIVNHLNKVKTNLGTFKAFGLSDQKLRSGYQYLLIILLAVSTVVGALFAFLLDLLLNLFGYDIHYQLFHPVIAVALMLVFFISLFISRHFIKRILSYSPGDLVFGRDGE